MGKKSREIIGDRVDELIMLLNRAYADEWIAYFYYTHAARMAQGLNAPSVADALEKAAKDELEHINELAERIVQLGGEPIRDFTKLVPESNCPYVKLPGSWSDLKAILKAVIDAERCAIDVYSNILKWLKDIGKDPVTWHVIRHIMSEEIEHEDMFETILGEDY
ncbi:MAG: ferritin-like domain-containing protein [Candidatus Njordarchaeia archaeon]|nr:bacterioferritin [Candidatus Korarchaeota archaeon]